MSKSPATALVPLPCALLVAACASFSPAPVNRTPDASLLGPCIDPRLAENEDTASDNEIAAERVRVMEAYLACKRRQADLAAFVRGHGATKTSAEP